MTLDDLDMKLEELTQEMLEDRKEVTADKAGLNPRRALLANAHASYLSASPHLSFHELELTLHATGTIAETDNLVTVSLDSTTILVELQTGELLELDAYGNVIRGAKD